MRKKSTSTKLFCSRTQTPIPPEDGLASLFRFRKLLNLERDTDSLVRDATSLESQLIARCRKRSGIRVRIEKLKEELGALHLTDEQEDHLERLGDLHKQLNEGLAGCPSDRVPGTEDDTE